MAEPSHADSSESRQGRVLLTLGPPPSVNRIWQRGRGGGVFRSRAYSTWLRASHLLCGQAGAILGSVVIRISIHGGKGWRQGRDIDNAAKPIIDFLVHSGVIMDDNYEVVRRVSISYYSPASAKDKAYVRVSVRRCASEP